MNDMVLPPVLTAATRPNPLSRCPPISIESPAGVTGRSGTIPS